MIDPSAIPAGTRVEITDPTHEWYRAKGVVLDDEGVGSNSDVVVIFEQWRSRAFKPNQLRTINSPEPTIGQLIDAIHQVAKKHGRTIKRIDLDEGYGEPDNRYGRVALWTKGSGMIPDCAHGKTPQAALLAMIERLERLDGIK